MNVPDTAAMSVALLSDKPTRNEHLRAALDALGATVAYESIADTFDRGALERSGASVVIVNLDDGDNSEFDAVYDLLDDDRYRVLINDGGVSSALSGWDQARWMRHLGAKIFGNADIHPPRPPHAEAVPESSHAGIPDAAREAVAVSQPEPVAAMPAADRVAANDLSIDMPAAPDVPSLEARADASDLRDFDFDLAPVPAAPSAGAQAPDTLALADDFDFDLPLAPASPGNAPHAPEAETLADDFDFEMPPVPVAPAFDAAAGHAAAGADESIIELTGLETEEVSELADWTLADDDLVAAPPPPAPSAFEDAAQAQAASEPAELPLGDFDLDLDFDAPPPPVQLESPGDVLHSSGDSSEWSIDELLNDVLAPPPVHADDEVVVDKVSAAEYLAPESEGTAPPPVPSDGGFTLELVPLEDVVAPVAIEKASHENWLDPDAAANAKIRRIWVLGASIGGPEAVRVFLGQLPAGYPALFLLAQHLGDEFVETMTRQLARSIALTVRTPAHGDRASHGEVFVVPNGKRLLVEPNGVVVLQDIAEQPAYRPSIDRVLEDVAERFGANAGAVVFSGMSDDAAEGCKAIAARGGSVYVQSPDSCVVSTMIDGVLETGVVQFQGTPEELARKLNEERA